MNVSSPLQDAARRSEIKTLVENIAFATLYLKSKPEKAVKVINEECANVLALLSEDRPAVTREQVQALKSALQQAETHCWHVAPVVRNLMDAAQPIVAALLKEGREEPPQLAQEALALVREFYAVWRDRVIQTEEYAKWIHKLSQLGRKDHFAEAPPTPSEVEPAPPSAICCDGDAYELVDWPQELSKVGQGYLLWRPDGVVMPLGEHTAKRFLVGAQWAGAALYRLRVEPQPPVPTSDQERRAKFLSNMTGVPMPKALELTLLMDEGAEGRARAYWQNIRDTEYFEPPAPAQTLTQGGEKS